MIKWNQLPVQVDPVMRAAETINPVPIGTKHANSHELLVGGGDTDQFGFATDCKRGCIEDRVDGLDAFAPAAIIRSACNRLRF